MNDNSSLEKKKYLKEMVTNQLKTVPPNRRLIYKDLARITKYINSSIFGDECCIWDGYITNAKNAKKGTYINFFFRNKKVALHRLEYENFVGPLGDDYYIKFSCENEENRGKCCNVNHMLKYKYNAANMDDDVCGECSESNEPNIQNKDDNKKANENNDKEKEKGKTNIEKLTITFD